MSPFKSKFTTGNVDVAITLYTDEWAVRIRTQEKPRFWGLVGSEPQSYTISTNPWNPFVLFQCFMVIGQLQNHHWQVYQAIEKFVAGYYGRPDETELQKFFARFEWNYSPAQMVQFFNNISYQGDFMVAVVQRLQIRPLDLHDAWIFTFALEQEMIPVGQQATFERADVILNPEDARRIYSYLSNLFGYYKDSIDGLLSFLAINNEASLKKVATFEWHLIRLLEKEDLEGITNSRMWLIMATAIVQFLNQRSPDNMLNRQVALTIASDWYYSVNPDPRSESVRQAIRSHMEWLKEWHVVWRVLDYGPYTNLSHKPLLIQLIEGVNAIEVM